jgi:hypothetical protein
MDMAQVLQLQHAFMEAGIVPIRMSANDLGLHIFQDVNHYLDTLPPDEARKIKRKFRKLWRKAVAESTGNSKTLIRHAKKLYGLGTPNPEKKHKMARKSAVMRYFDKIVKSST